MEGHPGNVRLFEGAFAHEDGKAVIATVTQQDLKESGNTDFPLLLTTGRVMHHYLTGVQTRKSSKLNQLYDEPLLSIHPETAKKYQLDDQVLAKIQSKWGSAVFRICYTTGIREDTLFVAFHWGDIQSINRVVNPYLDPYSKMPEFKITPVTISRF
jgi:assimilatory nitrate reductase catalytic subunit